LAFLLALGCEAIDSLETNDVDGEELDGRASTGHASNNLVPGGALARDQYLQSSDGSHRLYLQGDGNLVLRRMSDKKALWSSGTSGKSATQFKFQSDGNLVLFTASKLAVWQSKTAGSNATELHLHSAGQLVLYRNSTVVWSVNGSPAADNCPNDPKKTEPGQCGCGVPEGTCSGDDGSLETAELVRRVAALPDKTLVVFDFDDTLYDHVDGGTSKWASYAKSAVDHLKQRGIAISVCSRNKNSSGSLNRSLRGLDSQVFNDAFFNSPAFQTDTGLDKSDDIRQAMAHFGIRRDSQVVFFDDNQGNLDRVNAATDVISIMVHSNGIDRNEFRDGMSKRLGGR
jgi:hypothetical protein